MRLSKHFMFINVSLSCHLCTVGKSENLPEVEDSVETSKVEETEVVQPASESDKEESEAKPEAEQDENGSGSESTFSYDRLKSKSDNPVTGIDFKRREVGYSEKICNSSSDIFSSFF